MKLDKLVEITNKMQCWQILNDFYDYGFCVAYNAKIAKNIRNAYPTLLQNNFLFQLYNTAQTIKQNTANKTFITSLKC